MFGTYLALHGRKLRYVDGELAVETGMESAQRKRKTRQLGRRLIDFQQTGGEPLTLWMGDGNLEGCRVVFLYFVWREREKEGHFGGEPQRGGVKKQVTVTRSLGLLPSKTTPAGT